MKAHMFDIDGQGISPMISKVAIFLFNHYQAIENFAVTVKSTAQMLQKFGTDLAETELPNDVQCTKDLLSAHTDKHDKLKVRII